VQTLFEVSSADVAAQALRAVQTLLVDLDGAGAIVIASADGFELAHGGRMAVAPARLAALVSSFAALGDVASRESGIGTARCLVIDSSQGRLMVRRMQLRGQAVVVVVLTDASVLLGRVWHSLAAAERLVNDA
jgi:predicted regulator of Ras-like GTPase activity (Roadblock/LC7/MglB family)